MTTNTPTDDTPKPKRTICYCRDCVWAAEFAPRHTIPAHCPQCKTIGLSYVTFHAHEKAQADTVLFDDVGKHVDDVKPYEET